MTGHSLDINSFTKGLYMRVVSRLARLSDTLKNLRPLTGSWFAAVGVVVLRKIRPNSVLKGRYNSQNFLFRSIDSNALFEVFRDDEYNFLEPYIVGADSPLVVDVGAHIGTFAIWTFAHNPHAEILSVEADPQTFSVLERNRALADVAWRTVHRAASKSDGEALLFSDDGPSMSHRLSAEGHIKVPSISLESLIGMAGQTKQIDILKIDIEGAEESFLSGKEQVLFSVKCLVVELHPKLCDIDNVIETLRRRFANIEYVEGRTSTKPLIICRD